MFRALQSPQQKPRSPGLRQTKNAATRYLFRGIKGRGSPTHRRAGIPNPSLRFTGDCRAESIQSPVGLAGRRPVYLRLTIQAYESAYGCRRSAPALPVLRLADAIAAHTCKEQPGFRPSQLRLQLVWRRPQSLPARGSFGTRLASSRAGLTCHPQAAFPGDSKAVNTDSAAANAAPAAAHIVCSG